MAHQTRGSNVRRGRGGIDSSTLDSPSSSWIISTVGLAADPMDHGAVPATPITGVRILTGQSSSTSSSSTPPSSSTPAGIGIQMIGGC